METRPWLGPLQRDSSGLHSGHCVPHSLGSSTGGDRRAMRGGVLPLGRAVGQLGHRATCRVVGQQALPSR